MAVLGLLKNLGCEELIKQSQTPTHCGGTHVTFSYLLCVDSAEAIIVLDSCASVCILRCSVSVSGQFWIFNFSLLVYTRHKCKVFGQSLTKLSGSLENLNSAYLKVLQSTFCWNI